MSIVNMFRKEALRNQYKSGDIGKSIINQPSIINSSILILLLFFVFGFLIVNTFGFSINKNYKVKVSAENYTPIVNNDVVSINEYFIKDGEAVNKNQRLVSISTLGKSNNLSNIKTSIMHSPSEGVFFHSKIEENIVKPFTPLGYLLNAPNGSELSFWIEAKEPANIRVNDKVKLLLEDKVINGIITIIIGNSSSREEQKVYIKLKDADFSLLSPKANIEILLSEQSEKIINFIR